MYLRRCHTASPPLSSRRPSYFSVWYWTISSTSVLHCSASSLLSSTIASFSVTPYYLLYVGVVPFYLIFIFVDQCKVWCNTTLSPLRSRWPSHHSVWHRIASSTSMLDHFVSSLLSSTIVSFGVASHCLLCISIIPLYLLFVLTVHRIILVDHHHDSHLRCHDPLPQVKLSFNILFWYHLYTYYHVLYLSSIKSTMKLNSLFL